MEFGCSLCEYTSSKKDNVLKHFNKKTPCGIGVKEVIEIPINIHCEYCNKDFATRQHLVLHIKNNCKQKNKIIREENTTLKEENKKLKKDKILEEEITILKDKITALEEENKKLKQLKINSKNIIRDKSRKLYKENFKMTCVHCNNLNEDIIQVCHIKPVKEFDILNTMDSINSIDNLIGLCANCHLELDKTKNFKVVRTAILHSFIIKHLQQIKRIT